MAFFRRNFFSIVITILLTVLTAFAANFFRTAQARETRLRKLEVTCPKNASRIESLEESIKTCLEKIEKLQERSIQRDQEIIRQLENQLFILQRIEKGGSK